MGHRGSARWTRVSATGTSAPTVNGVDVSTVVYLPPEPIYEFLADFPRYGAYSDHLERVERVGEGPEGPRYAITASWWVLSHTVRSEVTAMAPPVRIEWRLLDALAAHGAWDLQHAPAAAPSGPDTATRVTLEIRYDPASVSGEAVNLPAFVSLDGIVDRVAPVVQREAEAAVERVVADLEGAPRAVSLEVSEPSTAD